MSAVTQQKFVLLQENNILEQFVRHRSTPAVHRQASGLQISGALASSDLVSYLKLTSRTQGCMLASGDAGYGRRMQPQRVSQ